MVPGRSRCHRGFTGWYTLSAAVDFLTPVVNYSCIWQRGHECLFNEAATELDMAETATLTKDDVIEALRDVYDPEIPVNIVDLGLVYVVEVADGDVHVEMTLTAPGCGMGPYIAQQAEWRIAELEGVEDVQVDVVFDPPWSPDRITEEGKQLLGLD